MKSHLMYLEFREIIRYPRYIVILIGANVLIREFQGVNGGRYDPIKNNKMRWKND